MSQEQCSIWFSTRYKSVATQPAPVGWCEGRAMRVSASSSSHVAPFSASSDTSVRDRPAKSRRHSIRLSRSDTVSQSSSTSPCFGSVSTSRDSDAFHAQSCVAAVKHFSSLPASSSVSTDTRLCSAPSSPGSASSTDPGTSSTTTSNSAPAFDSTQLARSSLSPRSAASDTFTNAMSDDTVSSPARTSARTNVCTSQPPSSSCSPPMTGSKSHPFVDPIHVHTAVAPMLCTAFSVLPTSGSPSSSTRGCTAGRRRVFVGGPTVDVVLSRAAPVIDSAAAALSTVVGGGGADVVWSTVPGGAGGARTSLSSQTNFAISATLTCHASHMRRVPCPPSSATLCTRLAHAPYASLAYRRHRGCCDAALRCCARARGVDAGDACFAHRTCCDTSCQSNRPCRQQSSSMPVRPSGGLLPHDSRRVRRALLSSCPKASAKRGCVASRSSRHTARVSRAARRSDGLASPSSMSVKAARDPRAPGCRLLRRLPTSKAGGLFARNPFCTGRSPESPDASISAWSPSVAPGGVMEGCGRGAGGSERGRGKEGKGVGGGGRQVLLDPSPPSMFLSLSPSLLFFYFPLLLFSSLPMKYRYCSFY
eukprot:Rhum_TRINITY_DN18948_c0_g1::Rhum_TRINITY_DN18948_c0_g1_i1::g.168877::m.168877